MSGSCWWNAWKGGTVLPFEACGCEEGWDKEPLTDCCRFGAAWYAIDPNAFRDPSGAGKASNDNCPTYCSVGAGGAAVELNGSTGSPLRRSSRGPRESFVALELTATGFFAISCVGRASAGLLVLSFKFTGMIRDASSPCADAGL